MGIFLFQNKKAIYFRIPKTASSSILINLKKSNNLKNIPDEDVNIKDYKNYFKFAFVRNPFDRLASCYRHIIQRRTVGSVFLKNYGISHNMPFEDFVEVINNQKIEEMNIHWKPQYCFIPEKPDFIGKFENLQEDYYKICEMIGLPKEVLPWENSTGTKTDYSIYQKDILNKVTKIYEKDFEMLGYKKTLPIH